MTDAADKTATFRTELLLAGKTATGVQVPTGVVEALGAGKRPPVRVTIGGHTYPSTIAARGERFLIPVSAENRELAGVQAGEEVEVTITLDAAPREVEVPEALAVALAAEPAAAEFFAGLTASQQKTFTDPVRTAKADETRDRRVAKALDALREGRKRP